MSEGQATWTAMTPRRRTLITVTVMLASILQVLDSTIANVALPHIQGSLSATQDQMSWVLTSYIIAAAIMTPLSGWFASRFGRRRILLLSILGFTLSSAACGIAQSLPQMVCARLLQGLSGAALVPMSQAVLLDINPRERHARAMSVWAMGVTAGPILGPTLGGWLTEHYTWRWVFFINVPIGVLCVLGVLAFMHESERRDAPFDFFGFGSLGVAIGSLQLMLDRGPANDWFDSVETWLELGVCATAVYLFVVHVLTTRRPPFVSGALFKDRNFNASLIFMFASAVVLFASLVLMPPLLQGLLGYPVLLAGLIGTPRGVGAVVAMLISGRFLTRADPRVVIAFGFVMTACSLVPMTRLSLQMDYDVLIWAGLFQGVGTGFAYAPLSALAFSTLSAQLRNEGTAVFSLIRNLGSSAGIAIVVALLTHNTEILHARLAEHVTPYLDPLAGFSAQALATTQGLAAVNAEVNRQAAMMAYNNDFKLLLVLTICVVPLVMLLRTSRQPFKGEPMVME